MEIDKGSESVLDSLQAESTNVTVKLDKVEKEKDEKPIETDSGKGQDSSFEKEEENIVKEDAATKNKEVKDEPPKPTKIKTDSPTVKTKARRSSSPSNSEKSETPQVNKRPRRSATVVKKEEPKPKRSKSTPKKGEKESKEKDIKEKEKKSKSLPKTKSKKAEGKTQTTPVRQKKKSADSDVVEEFVDCEYLKGEIIAVRSEGTDFYLAEVLDNIPEKDLVREFKVLWFDISEEEHIFVRSYPDKVDHRSVVCSEVKLKKESGGRWRMKENQLRKIKRRLHRALSGNPLSSSDDDQDEEDEKSMSALKLTEKETRHFSGKASKKSKKPFARTPVGIPGSSNSPKPYLTPINSPKTAGLTMVVEPKKSKMARTNNQEIVNQKAKYQMSPCRRGRPPIYDTAYIPNSNESPEKSTETSDSKTNQEEQDLSHFDCDSDLKPNSSIQSIETDPAFSASGNPFNLPAEVLAIKCILQRDFDSLIKLTSTPDISQNRKSFNLQGFRCPNVKRTVLHYALQSNDEEFVKMILSEISVKSEPNVTFDSNWTLMNQFVNRKDSNSEQGNKSLVKKTAWNVDWRDPSVAKKIAIYSCREGCTAEVLDLLVETYPKLHGGISFKELLIENVYQALECGHVKTALHLVETANNTKSSPCCFSELQLQTLCSTMDRHHPYQISIKPQEIRKKEIVNMRITAMHTAATNPNGQFLKRLLEMNPEARNNSDERGRRPVHYAAASYSSEPLQILFKRKDLNIDEVDKLGVTPLMVTAVLGRENNCLLLLERAKRTSMINHKSLVNRVDVSNYTSLHYAAQAGHENIIDLISKWGADLDKPLGIKTGRITPLMIACQHGHFKSAMALIKNGCKLEIRDKMQRTALMHAALNGHYPLVALLLNRGSNPNTVDGSDNTALHYAAAYGWYHVVQLLLQGGASPDVVNQERISPLAVSVLKYHDDVAQLLFNHGADPNLSDNQKRTLLMLLSTQKPSKEINERISYLLDHFSPSPNVQDIHGLTVFHHLASSELEESQQSEIVATAKLLLNGGADLNVKDYSSRTPLFLAVKFGNLPLIRFFLEKGASCPESRANDQNGENMLHLIVRMWRRGDMSHIVEKLCSQNADQIQDLANSRSKTGFTPFLLACKIMAECNEDLKGIILEYASNLINVLITVAKSDPSATVVKGRYSKGNKENRDDGKSAAHYLSTCSNTGLLQILLKYDPRIDCLDVSGYSPLTSALAANQNAAAYVLLEAGSLVDFCSATPQKQEFNLPPLLFACSRHGSKLGHDKEVNLIPAIKTMLERIECINNISKCKSTERTVLMFACQGAQDPALVKLILKKHAHVNERDSEGKSALHHAVINTPFDSHVSEVIELLLEAGADPYAADDVGRTCLHLAFSKQNHDAMELVALLTQKIDRSKIDLKDNDGNTVLHQACKIGAIASIIHLVSIGASIHVKNKDRNTPIGLTIKMAHQSATVLLTQLGAELNTKIVYKPEMCISTSIEDGYWISGLKKSKILRIEEVDAIEVVIKNKWNNVMTLMLSRLLKNNEETDSDFDMDRMTTFTFARCVEAACRVPDLETALVLVRRQKDEKEIKLLNQDQQTLLHILAINSRRNQPQLKEIADMLIKANVPLDAQDSKGITALHYAAYNKCDILVHVIIRAAGARAGALVNIYDNQGRTPVTSLFWNTQLNDTSSVRILTDFSVALGDLANVALSVPVPLPLRNAIESVDEENQLEYFQNPQGTFIITLIMRAIYVNGSRIIDKLLELSVDINSQVEANGNLTAIMLSVVCNNLTVVRRLLESDTPVLLSAQDNNCRTVLHHVTRPSKWGYWENLEILKLLVERGASLSDEDVHGKSALDYALEGGNGRLAGFLQELLNVETSLRDKPKAISTPLKDQIDFGFASLDFVTDAKSILEKINEDEEVTKKPPSPEVDSLSGMSDWGQIIEDLTTGLHGDVLLSEVEIKSSGDFVQNFTRMQIIGHKLKKQFVLFTRNGKVGEEGEWKITPFTIPENAIREFMKLYKAKTGNEWTALPDFRRCTKKHALVPFELMNRVQAADLEFDLNTEIVSKLLPDVHELFQELTNVLHLKEIVKGSILDYTIMPFGRLVKEDLQEGLNTLFDIQDLIIALHEAKKSMTNGLDTNRMQWFLEQAMSLTFDFNKSVPHPGKRFDRIKLLSDLDDIQSKICQTRDLLKLEFANNLLLAAQYRINDVNPIDYIYKSLNCSIVPLAKNSDEALSIIKYIENSGCESTVMNIFKTYHAEDVDNLVASKVDNHKLLWKPITLTDLLYTLANGAKVPYPQKARKENPMRYRKALDKPDDDPFSVYYEMFNDIKSMCSLNCSELKYALLCQVAVGKSKDLMSMPKSRPEGVFDSLKISGKDTFSSEYNQIVSPEGASIPLGTRICTNSAATFTSNRYVVYNDTKQMAVRYLIRYH